MRDKARECRILLGDIRVASNAYIGSMDLLTRCFGRKFIYHHPQVQWQHSTRHLNGDLDSARLSLGGVANRSPLCNIDTLISNGSNRYESKGHLSNQMRPFENSRPRGLVCSFCGLMLLVKPMPTPGTESGGLSVDHSAGTCFLERPF